MTNPHDPSNPYGQSGGSPAPGAWQQPGPYGQAPGGPVQPSGGFPANQPGQPPVPPGGFSAPPAYSGPGGYHAPLGPESYAHWGRRVGAYLLDALPYAGAVLVGVLIGLLVGGEKFGGVGAVFMALGYVGGFGWIIYNRWVRGGSTGQSLGKRVLKIKLVDETTRQPIGGGKAFLRDLCHVVDGLVCYLGYLWPLWDEKRQTLADKIVSTVVVPVTDAGQPGYGTPQQQYGQQAYGQPGGYPGQPPQQW